MKTPSDPRELKHTVEQGIKFLKAYNADKSFGHQELISDGDLLEITQEALKAMGDELFAAAFRYLEMEQERLDQ